ncbi:hypothetical protein C8A00DRAFT_47611 [Chaetomidium leptoderma]|uniref:Putative gamma-glutamylcyclotransferase n=1 Tax=Chaetomidium leptoderma TaxID=669021 RepID=A0AAN6ZSL7_9PEZI|nr:hypothetical protein C8A00DRAFT_47611 [Chaetomidium leptoderma]
MSSPPRPLFIYGTLRALPLLAWAITGDSSRADEMPALLQNGVVSDCKRCPVRGSDYPAAIKSSGSSVDGYLAASLTASQRRKLDDFEGETYKATPVTVNLLGEDGQPTGQIVEADMYVWDGDLERLDLEGCWSLSTFVKERLEDWLDLFGPIELVGGDMED